MYFLRICSEMLRKRSERLKAGKVQNFVLSEHGHEAKCVNHVSLCLWLSLVNELSHSHSHFWQICSFSGQICSFSGKIYSFFGVDLQFFAVGLLLAYKLCIFLLLATFTLEMMAFLGRMPPFLPCMLMKEAPETP